MSNKLGILIFVLISFGSSASLQASVETDIAFEKVAYRLELVRNQVELAIDNHSSVAGDVRRQQAELTGMEVFRRIPLASHDLKNDKDILDSIRKDLQARSGNDGESNFTVRKLKFKTPWKVSKKTIPSALPYDNNFIPTEEQVVDQREIELELAFDQTSPAAPKAWMTKQKNFVRRLIEPAPNDSVWKKHGKNLNGSIVIYRYRDFEYPKLLAPDLSRYTLPTSPGTKVQASAAKRMDKYRSDIIRLWPKAQPYLNDIRQFALNDLRMNFFLRHANVQ